MRLANETLQALRKESRVNNHSTSLDVSELEGVKIEEVDLSLPSSFSIRMWALHRLQKVQEAQQAELNMLASKVVGNKQEEDRLYRIFAQARMAVALLDRKCPEALARMQELAQE